MRSDQTAQMTEVCKIKTRRRDYLAGKLTELRRQINDNEALVHQCQSELEKYNNNRPTMESEAFEVLKNKGVGKTSIEKYNREMVQINNQSLEKANAVQNAQSKLEELRDSEKELVTEYSIATKQCEKLEVLLNQLVAVQRTNTERANNEALDEWVTSNFRLKN